MGFVPELWLQSLAASYSSIAWTIVPSALSGFTAEFGMGSGGSQTPWPPSCGASVQVYRCVFFRASCAAGDICRLGYPRKREREEREREGRRKGERGGEGGEKEKRGKRGKGERGREKEGNKEKKEETGGGGKQVNKNIMNKSKKRNTERNKEEETS